MTRDLNETADLHALGLLDEAEAAALEARRLADPALDAALTAAEARFAELSLSAPTLPPSPDLWPRILREIEATPVLRPVKGPARDPQPAPAAPRPGWRLVAVASLAASLLLAVGLGWSLLRPGPQVVAILLDAGGQPVAMIEAFRDDAAHVTMLTDVALPGGSALQLWTKPDPAGPPVSLGLLREVAARRVQGPDLPDPQDAQLYEITIEAATGSPTGLPTGPIVGKGFAKRPR